MLTSPQPLPVPLGQLVRDDGVSSLPLEHVDVNGQILGVLASVALTQRFANPFAAPIELTYRFAIPHRASLAGFALRIGDRSIEGDVARREEAEALYQRAVEAGQRAGLATEERPNLYTVRIGNVPPGETVVASYRYSLDLDFDGGRFELALPFGITPRYHRADETAEETRATDVAIAAPGSPIASLDVTMAIDAGVAIRDPESPSHRVEISRLDDRRCVVKLVAPRVPNQDFVLRYGVRASEGAVQSACWRSTGPSGDFLYAVFVPPPPGELNVTVVPREYIFVLDRSGSMSGHPVAQARNALRACLRTLTPEDTFRILLFDNQVEWFAPSRERALPFADAALSAADTFLDAVEGRGGTELLEALRAVVALPADHDRQRVIVVLTDGAISAEDQTIRVVAELPRRDRLFCLGIGPSVNRYLLDRLARAGRGVAEVVGLDEDIEGAIIRFQDRLSFPVLTDVALSASGLVLEATYPAPLPDLFAGQALQVVGRIREANRPGVPILELRGRRGDEQVAIEVALPDAQDESLIRRLWARKRIDALLERSALDEDQETIVALSREYHLLTPYTALIAVDQSAVNSDQRPQKIVVAVPLPEGLAFTGFMAAAVAPAPSRLAGAVGWMLDAVNRSPIARAPRAEPPSRLHAYNYSAPADRLSGQEAPSESRDLLLRPADLNALLRALIRAQQTSGAWGAEDGAVELTAAALVAFARAGHTPNRGTFRRPLQRALAWLQAKAEAPLERRFSCWARGEIAAADGDRAMVARARDESAGLVPTAGPDVGEAVAMRLEMLASGSEGAPAQPPAGTTDPRVWAILGLSRESAPARHLASPWEACFAVG